MKLTIELLSRILDAIFNAINKQNVKKAEDDPADTIAGDGTVVQLDKEFTDISDKSERD